MMLLIRKSSDKTPLQKQLDREQASNASTAVEELPPEQTPELQERPIFAKPKKAVFHVDLMGG